ncbi:hypothetical protein GCM10009836_09010 [Pseudonocardia ailaonensis]|uniref:Transmembrane protein n=1 Tax=Pseudonocardia ailaonensis TaxID=367279 RepID=A0ABN2MP57_9PSEU
MPLRRTDRVESLVGWALGVLGVLVLAIALVTGLSLHGQAMAQAASDETDRVSTEAVLLEPVESAIGVDPTAGAAQTQAMASWHAPDGSVRTGEIPVIGAQAAGSSVPVWTDRGGALTAPPVDALQADVTAVVGGLLVLILGGLLLLGVRALVRLRIAQVNARWWASRWALFEPVWSGRKA